MADPFTEALYRAAIGNPDIWNVVARHKAALSDNANFASNPTTPSPWVYGSDWTFTPYDAFKVFRENPNGSMHRAAGAGGSELKQNFTVPAGLYVALLNFSALSGTYRLTLRSGSVTDATIDDGPGVKAVVVQVTSTVTSGGGLRIWTNDATAVCTLTGAILYPADALNIFSFEPVNADYGLPAVFISGPTANLPNDTKNTLGRIQERDIFVYGKAEGSYSQIDLVAETLRETYHRRALTIAGHLNHITSVNGPVVAPTGAGYAGRMITVTIHTQEV